MKDGIHGRCMDQCWNCPNLRKKPTNADRIRAMSDEELAEHFSELIKDTYENEYCNDVNDWLNWLQSEVEE